IRSNTLTIPAGQPNGPVVITGFAVDSAGNPSSPTPPDTLFIQSSAGDVTPPIVTFVTQSRLEVDDSVTVQANDPSGIARIGFIVRNPAGTVVWAADSQIFSGSQTPLTFTFALGHPAPAANRGLDTVTVFPQLLTVEAFAVDSIGNKGFSSNPNSPSPI